VFFFFSLDASQTQRRVRVYCQILWKKFKVLVRKIRVLSIVKLVQLMKLLLPGESVVCVLTQKNQKQKIV
jgi:hypothetical protein